MPKITQLPPLAINDIQSADQLVIVDSSDKSSSSSGTTKGVSPDAFAKYNEVFKISEYVVIGPTSENIPVITNSSGRIAASLLDTDVIDMALDDKYDKTDFIDSFTGIPNQPIVTNADGLIPAELVDVLTFNFVDRFTPSAGTEYPDTTGYVAGQGATWIVEGLTDSGYTFTSGDLNGETTYNDAYMVFGTDAWVLMHNNLPGAEVQWGSIQGTLANQTDLQNALNLKADDTDLDAHTTNTNNPHDTNKTEVGLGNVENIKSNFNAVRAPQVTDDTLLGYSVGSVWVYSGTNRSWRCTNSDQGIAVWVETTVQGGGSASWGTISGNIEDQLDLNTELTTLQSQITPNTSHRTGAGDGATAHVSIQDRSDWDSAHGLEHNHTNKSLLDTYNQTNLDITDAIAHTDIITGNPHEVNKGDVGLGTVDNTSDADKPISDATQTALDLKYDKSDFIDTFTGVSGEPIKTGSNGLIPSNLVDIQTTQFVANFTPTGGNEYPNTTGYPSGNGYTWIIEGVAEPAGYTFVGGDLAGQTIYNDAWMIWGDGDVWVTSNNHSGGSTATAWGTITGTLADQTDLNNALGDKADASALTAHTGNVANPHTVTKAQVQLGNCDNTSDVNKPISDATQTALNAKADTTALTSHTTNYTNPHQVDKTDVDLANVNNTSDLNKPISTATQSALDDKANITDVGLTTGSAVSITNFWTGTQSQYDGLTPDANTIYFITA